MLRCATSRHAMPCTPDAIMQCHAHPAPRDMQCHAHPMPCAPFLTFVKHSAHFFVHACAGILGARCLLVRRNCFKMVSASRTVRNDVRLRLSSLDKVCRVKPPQNVLSALTSCQCAYAGICAWACVCARHTAGIHLQGAKIVLDAHGH